MPRSIKAGQEIYKNRACAAAYTHGYNVGVQKAYDSQVRKLKQEIAKLKRATG